MLEQIQEWGARLNLTPLQHDIALICMAFAFGNLSMLMWQVGAYLMGEKAEQKRQTRYKS